MTVEKKQSARSSSFARSSLSCTCTHRPHLLPRLPLSPLSQPPRRASPFLSSPRPPSRDADDRPALAQGLHGGLIASLVDTMGSLALASKGMYMTGVSTDMSQTCVALISPSHPLGSCAARASERVSSARAAEHEVGAWLTHGNPPVQVRPRGETRREDPSRERGRQHGCV